MQVARLSALLALLCWSSNSAAGPVYKMYSGYAKANKGQAISKAGVPLLSHFFLDFRTGDNEIHSIGIMPETPGNMTVSYMDRRCNNFFYWEAGLTFLKHPNVVTGEKTGPCSGGLCFAVLGDKPGDDYVFVLTGFRFTFPGVNNDHHMGRISIKENAGLLVIAFADKNGDDDFTSRVKYAWVPKILIKKTGHMEGRRRTSAHEQQPSGKHFVIRGFDLKFVSFHLLAGRWVPGDHHLQRIGIKTNNPSGLIDIHYSDDNGKDDFDWKLDWAVLRETIESNPVLLKPRLPVGGY